MPLKPAAERDVAVPYQREAERLRAAYAARTGEACYAESVAGRFQVQERERHVLGLLDQYGLIPLSGKRILEVGCGTGKWLRDLISWGADPEQLFGIELLQASAARARRLCPQTVTIECGNAAELRFEPASFSEIPETRTFSR